MQLLDIALCIPVRFIFGYVTFQIYRLTKRREAKQTWSRQYIYIYIFESFCVLYVRFYISLICTCMHDDWHQSIS